MSYEEASPPIPTAVASVGAAVPDVPSLLDILEIVEVAVVPEGSDAEAWELSGAGATGPPQAVRASRAARDTAAAVIQRFIVVILSVIT